MATLLQTSTNVPGTLGQLQWQAANVKKIGGSSLWCSNPHRRRLGIFLLA